MSHTYRTFLFRHLHNPKPEFKNFVTSIYAPPYSQTITLIPSYIRLLSYAIPRLEMGKAPKAEPTETRVLRAAPQPSQIDSRELAKTRDAISKHRKAIAWQVHRWPLDKKIIDYRTEIHLPRSYCAADGEDVKTVWAGADLNQVVHQHYAELLGDKTVLAHNSNFVTPDSITVKRCVVGFVRKHRSLSE